MRLGDLVEIEKGRKPSRIFAAPEGESCRLLQIEDLRPDANVRYCPRAAAVLAHKEDVLLAWDGANAGTASWGLEGAVGSTLAVLRIVDARVVSAYLGRYLRSKVGVLRASRNGATVPHINGGVLSGLEIPLPPLAEQHRIAAILDRAAALAELRRRAINTLDALSARLIDAVVGSGACWPVRSIGEIAFVRGGKRLPKGEEYASAPTPFRYVRVTDLQGGRVNESALVYLKPEVQARISRYTVEAGDIIISIAGSIGLVAPVPESLAGANLTENAAKLVPKVPGTYEATYLSEVLRTGRLQAQIRSHVGQVTIGKLALFRIEKLEVPLPPIALQHEFAARIAAIERLRASYRASLTKLDELFASLQDRAFRGEL